MEGEAVREIMGPICPPNAQGHNTSRRTSYVSCVEMFAMTLLPSLSVHGAWTLVKDACGWAAVDVAGHLGDVSLHNISLLASMQPTNIQEAIMATSAGAVGRTKLRLVYVAACCKFGLDPIDVGAPLGDARLGPIQLRPAGLFELGPFDLGLFELGQFDLGNGPFFRLRPEKSL